MIERQRRQISFGDGLIADEASSLGEDWMEPADQLLQDEELLTLRWSRFVGQVGSEVKVYPGC